MKSPEGCIAGRVTAKTKAAILVVRIFYLEFRMLQDTIFVFGSNRAGRHGKGAAQYALRYCGATYGQEEGLQGRAYALPTKARNFQILSLAEIKEGVERFLRFAVEHPELKFQVTRIACGLAKMQDEDIFPLFRNAPPNCLLPGIWEAKRTGVQRLLIDGSRTCDNYDLLYEEADKAIAAWGLRSTEVEIVHTIANGAPSLALRYAKERGLPSVAFEAYWNRLGKNAGTVCNESMAWYATHALILWDGKSGDAKHMHETAQKSRLRTRPVLFEPTVQPVARVAPKGISPAGSQPDQAKQTSI
jgi:hypothetical protein